MSEDISAMEKLRQTFKTMETAMMAASFAEEGETNAARELVNEERRILLAVRRGQIDRKTFRYALNTCKRIGAHLDVLYISSDDERNPVLDECLSELKAEGVEYRLMHKKGSLKQSIIDYANEKKEILFAVTVTESSENPGAEQKGKGKSKSHVEGWQDLKCPLVVVGEPA
jgi:type II secretory pathway component PulJ